MSSADLKGALGALRRSWRAERAREQRVVVLDPGTDVGDWEQMVATLQRLERSGLVDAAGLLGWDVLVPCGEFLAQAAGLHAEHAGRGRVAAPALWRLCTASGTAGAAAAILAGGDVFDRADWDSAGGREGLCPTLRTMWAGTGAREADVADFLRRAATAGGPLVARAQGWLRASVGDASVGSSGGPSLGGASGAGLGHWSAGELRLEVPAASCPVTIEVVTAAGTGMVAPGVPAGSPELPGGPPDPPGGPSNPPGGPSDLSAGVVAVGPGWSATELGEPEQLYWSGPELLGTDEAAALAAFCEGREYRCPTCGSDEGHRDGAGRLTLRCLRAEPRRGLVYDRPRWALPGLERAAGERSGRPGWVAVSVGEGPVAELWRWDSSLLPLGAGRAMEGSEPGRPVLVPPGPFVEWPVPLVEGPGPVELFAWPGPGMPAFLPAASGSKGREVMGSVYVLATF